ncbi:MBL fold metallo-hydrolase [Spongiactinospora gelatinilytica]|uniref:MBL fold metallo-hydrolase n=1 Tax=Spongiactinospora gelatinilytica TaxID=2666298 RepID=UPI0018F69AB2|nr:MBL fold metallo-hydrolase [Spongiactinospora gelatinilytica]
MAAEILTGPAYGELRLRPPEVTFETRMALHIGERRIDLLHAGPAHTRGDVIAWLPEERVAFAGDLVINGGQPFLVEGSVAGYPRALAMLRELDPGAGPRARRDLPGRGGPPGARRPGRIHGPRGRPGPVRAQDRRTAADHGPRRGPFADWTESERLVGNLHRAYHELDGNPPGSPLALPASGPTWSPSTAARSPATPEVREKGPNPTLPSRREPSRLRTHGAFIPVHPLRA